jgi:hypothetical protein
LMETMAFVAGRINRIELRQLLSQWIMLLQSIRCCSAVLCCMLLIREQENAASTPGPDRYGSLAGSIDDHWIETNQSRNGFRSRKQPAAKALSP